MVRFDQDPVKDPFDAAGWLAQCVPLAEADQTLAESQRRQTAAGYADRAMDLLRQAIAKGYKDVKHLTTDKEFDPLRQRDDFKQLLAELESKAK